MSKLRVLWERLISKMPNREQIDEGSKQKCSQLPLSWQQYAPFVKIHPDAVVDQSATLQITFVPDTTKLLMNIGANSHVFGHFVIQHPMATIFIGERCHIGSSHFICTTGIDIGDDVIISWGITVMDTNNHSIYWEERKHDTEVFLQEFKDNGIAIGKNHDWKDVIRHKIIIGDKSWIGFNSIVLKGVITGEGSIIGAGSVVTKNTPAWSLNAGNPCRFIKNVSSRRPPSPEQGN